MSRDYRAREGISWLSNTVRSVLAVIVQSGYAATGPVENGYRKPGRSSIIECTASETLFLRAGSEVGIMRKAVLKRVLLPFLRSLRQFFWR